MNLLERAAELADRGRPVAMLTVVRKDGHAPRGVGTRMLVTPDDTFGTIGGGTVERLAVDAAREVLAGDADPGVRSFDLEPGGNTGMVCGGAMDVFVDRLRGQPRLFIAGGGHIAAELAPLAVRLGYDVTVVDDRDDFAVEGRFPDDVSVVHGDYGQTLAELPLANAALVVATRSGTFDRAALAAGLDAEAGYLGLVASDTKAERVLDDLDDDGYARRALARVRAPVGLDLGGGAPEDVALAVLAELHRDRHDADGDRLTRLNLDDLVVVRGGGDLASGVVFRLQRAGRPVLVAEVERPTAVRRAVAFAEAVYEGAVEIEGLVGRRVDDVDEAVAVLGDGDVPVLVDPEAAVVDALEPAALVDATMAKGQRDTGTRRGLADVVVGLGPGFVAGGPEAGRAAGTEAAAASGVANGGEAGTADGRPMPVDAVVETHRGHELGRVYYDGTAAPYDGVPGERDGVTHERVLRAPENGEWSPAVDIGDLVEAGDVVGHVAGEPVEAQVDGRVRGLVHPGLDVDAGAKLGDVDPRGDDVDPAAISDKALAVGGGVLEALLKLG
ncbi:MAG: XdhC family protein [Halobacteriales archaeon]